MSNELSPQQKIALFKSIFTGRTDVFAQYWQSPDGKVKAWYPVHTDRTKTTYRPLTDAIIEDHLRDNRILGIYPLLQNNTSWFVAADFDGAFYLDALFLVYPFSSVGKLTQYVGRILHSDSAVKTVYDYRDESVPYFYRMYKKRKKYYDAHYPQKDCYSN